jgi:hypothetical protein
VKIEFVFSVYPDHAASMDVIKFLTDLKKNGDRFWSSFTTPETVAEYKFKCNRIRAPGVNLVSPFTGVVDNDELTFTVNYERFVFRFAISEFTSRVLGTLLANIDRSNWGLWCVLADVECALEKYYGAKVPAVTVVAPSLPTVTIDGNSYCLHSLIFADVNRVNFPAFLAAYRIARNPLIAGGVVNFIIEYSAAYTDKVFYKHMVLNGGMVKINPSICGAAAEPGMNSVCEYALRAQFGGKPWKIRGFGGECEQILRKIRAESGADALDGEFFAAIRDD